ncbi:MAG: 50S ribosomal protein L24 [Armatimonadetes bacterium]|nr:50S ribosomal protein L24 [Armatimonadota bacterium]
MALKVGDTVEVLTGKDRGERGQITEVLPFEQRVRVSGVNTVIKHQRAAGRSRAMQQQAGRIQLPGTIHVSNVMLVCPTCGQRTRPRQEGEGLAKQRACRKCGAVIARVAPEE